MVIFFWNTEERALLDIIYSNRDKIRILVKALRCVSPKEIYCCSAPGYNVIFANKHDYEKANQRGDFITISAAIEKEVKKRCPVLQSHVIEALLQVKFHHPEMNGFNWHGFARQD